MYLALDVVFASLYNNELEIQVKHLDGIVAAAAIMQIVEYIYIFFFIFINIQIFQPTILEKCDEVASENLKLENVLHYHSLANSYGLKGVFILFNWQFLKNSCIRNCMKEVFYLNSLTLFREKQWLRCN